MVEHLGLGQLFSRASPQASYSGLKDPTLSHLPLPRLAIPSRQLATCSRSTPLPSLGSPHGGEGTEGALRGPWDRFPSIRVQHPPPSLGAATLSRRRSPGSWLLLGLIGTTPMRTGIARDPSPCPSGAHHPGAVACFGGEGRVDFGDGHGKLAGTGPEQAVYM